MQQIDQQQEIYRQQQHNIQPQMEMVACDICNQQFTTRHGMAIHKGIKHRPANEVAKVNASQQKRRIMPLVEMHRSAASAAAANARQKKRRLLPIVVKTENQVIILKNKVTQINI